jgi:hypothetical protein
MASYALEYVMSFHVNFVAGDAIRVNQSYPGNGTIIQEEDSEWVRRMVRKGAKKRDILCEKHVKNGSDLLEALVSVFRDSVLVSLLSHQARTVASVHSTSKETKSHREDKEAAMVRSTNAECEG